jgi:hypothetical protein
MHMYKYKVVCLEKIKWILLQNSYIVLILSAMDYIKMNLSKKPNVTVSIITILEILSKMMAHIKNVSKFYTY